MSLFKIISQSHVFYVITIFMMKIKRPSGFTVYTEIDTNQTRPFFATVLIA